MFWYFICFSLVCTVYVTECKKIQQSTAVGKAKILSGYGMFLFTELNASGVVVGKTRMLLGQQTVAEDEHCGYGMQDLYGLETKTFD